MPYTAKPNEKEARERLRAFWVGSSLGRPALFITVDPHPTEAPNPQSLGSSVYASGSTVPEAPNPQSPADEFNLEYQLISNWRDLAAQHYLAEAMPGFRSFQWGGILVTLAVFAGGDYELRDRSGWVNPIENLYDRPLPVFDPQHPVAIKIRELYRAIAQVVGDRGYVNPPVMLDGMTTLSLFRTPDSLCVDLLQQPHDVRRWASALTQMYIDIYDHFYQFIRSLGPYGDTTTWLGALAEGRLEAVQCDFSVMISPEMYREFVLPDLIRVTEYMDYSLYHLDGIEQMRFLDMICQCPKLNGIQWNPATGGGKPMQYLGALREIRRRKMSLHVGCDTVEEAVGLTRELGPDGLFLVLPPFATLAEAEQAIRDIARVC